MKSFFVLFFFFLCSDKNEGLRRTRANKCSFIGAGQGPPSLDEDKRTELCRWSHGQSHCSTKRHQLAVLRINTSFFRTTAEQSENIDFFFFASKNVISFHNGGGTGTIGYSMQ